MTWNEFPPKPVQNRYEIGMAGMIRRVETKAKF